MAPETFAEIEGIGMEREEVDTFLREQGVGVLSLTDGQEAYGVPVSFGYDGEDSLYFVFLRIGEQSKKEQFAEQTERASLTVYNVDSKHVWTSVIVSGSLHQIPDREWNELETAIEDNAWYPSLFSEAEPMRDIQGWELRMDDVTGQQSEG
ncbi:pyridoxamine 5'-phosphate oxidase family protein [Haladaptatus salinisoli]|uniref:pyridoxamine 5'-phosphate oxidase family protein n=1 Tax=Haladaptatus salinisoli TaxID=2884876 RepID=UPI001D0A357C|nr:pyridoxamine 5'-phosphate oxidase family protein [Haladaptatus salinisoli]